MLGNRAGWIIAFIVLATECAALFYALSLDAHAKPTSLTSSEALAPLRVPPVPESLRAETGPADAGALYRAAISEYLAQAGAIETMIRDSDRVALTKLAALDKILAARSARSGPIFANHLDQVVAYGETTSLQAIERLGVATYRAGLLQGKRPADRARAMEHYHAAFALGRRLVDERLTWREYDAGVNLMSSAGAAMIAELARSPDRSTEAAALQAFLDAQQAQYRQLVPLFEAIYTNNEPKIAMHAGDVFAFASDSQETMWRVEAILKLGRMRYNVGTPALTGNQRHATRLLRKLNESNDPVIRRAAELALELTPEAFRTLR